MRRGRWYECVGGLGLLVERERLGCQPVDESNDPDYRWRSVGHIETRGKKRKSFVIHVHHPMGPGYVAETLYELDDAKAAILKRFGVTEIAECEVSR